LVIVLVGLLAGCATTTHRQAAELQRTQGVSRIVLMPIDVELSHVTAGGLLEPDAGWTEQAQRNMHTALMEEARSRKVELVDFDPNRGTPEDREKSLDLVKLHRAVGSAILVHEYIPELALPSKKGKFDWSLGQETAAIARSQNADYAMFLFVRDSYTTGGRAALIALVAVATLGRGILQGGSQVGFASVVDLKTGDIVWFNRLARGSGDLRTPEVAGETVNALVGDSMK
jgi:hypothetical protein